MSMKNSIETIGNRTRDLPVCSTVPQPTASPRVLWWSNKVFSETSRVHSGSKSQVSSTSFVQQITWWLWQGKFPKFWTSSGIDWDDHLRKRYDTGIRIQGEQMGYQRSAKWWSTWGKQSIAEKYSLHILRERTDVEYRKWTSVDCRHGTSMK
jgi:hypothetical protein